MKTLITDFIDLINEDATATEVNVLLLQHLTDYNRTTLESVKIAKVDIVKRFYNHKIDYDTEYDGLLFQADAKSRNEVITPCSTKALQAKLENNTSWVQYIASNSKDVNGHDIVKGFSFQEMLDFADNVTADVNMYFFQRKTHCNNIEDLTEVQDVLNYDFS